MCVRDFVVCVCVRSCRFYSCACAYASAEHMGLFARRHDYKSRAPATASVGVWHRTVCIWNRDILWQWVLPVCNRSQCESRQHFVRCLACRERTHVQVWTLDNHTFQCTRYGVCTVFKAGKPIWPITHSDINTVCVLTV